MRLLHWMLVLMVAASWLTSSSTGPLHEYFGYGAGIVAFARFTWGFLGSTYARFAQFVHSPKPTWQYLREVAAGNAPRYLGHNPLGGWMVVALLSCIAALVFTGWLYTTDMFWGYGWLASLHAWLGWLLLIMIAFHVTGVIFTSFQHRENLISAMFNGKKAPPRGDDVA